VIRCGPKSLGREAFGGLAYMSAEYGTTSSLRSPAMAEDVVEGLRRGANMSRRPDHAPAEK